MSKKEKKLNKKAEKKAAKEAKKAAKKNNTPAPEAEIDTAENKNALFKCTIVKCVAALLSTVIVCVSVSSVVGKMADTIKNMPVSENVAANSDNAVIDSDASTDTPAFESEATDSETSPADDITSVDSEDSTQADTPAASEGSSSSTSTPDKKPAAADKMTKAQIITLFNNAANSAKTNAKSIKQNQCKNTQTSEASIGNSKILKDVATKLINANMGDDKTKTGAVYTSAAEKKANFPVRDQSWSSKLTEADVKNATVTEANGVYTVKIALIDDTTPNIKQGQGHAGKAFSIVTKDQIVEGAGSAGMAFIKEESIQLTYKNCTITAKIDKATGKLQTVHYFQDWKLNLTAIGIDVAVSFGIDEDYTINW